MIMREQTTYQSPPPTRGWSPDLEATGAPAAVSPAHAGMVPPHAHLRRPEDRLPRPRGDGPVLQVLWPAQLMSPPPTRGWSRHGEAAQRPDDVSPAHAGMVPELTAQLQPTLSLPRPRGDGPLTFAAAHASKSSPPPTRGWSLIHPLKPACGDVSPAHAGMVPESGSAKLRRRCLPRPRGDGPGSLSSAAVL